jgi:hypothetical protein
MKRAIVYNGEWCNVSVTEVIPGTNGTLALQLVSKAHRRRWLWPRLTTLRGPGRTSVRGRDLLHQGRRSVAVITHGTVGRARPGRAIASVRVTCARCSKRVSDPTARKFF